MDVALPADLVLFAAVNLLGIALAYPCVLRLPSVGLVLGGDGRVDAPASAAARRTNEITLHVGDDWLQGRVTVLLAEGWVGGVHAARLNHVLKRRR